MASTMPASKKADPARRQRCVLLWLLLLAWPAAGWGGEFVVRELGTRLTDDGYLVDARIDYRFSERAIEALNNGVPLTLEVDLRLRRSDAWPWEPDIVGQRLFYRIRYHALASVYQVRDLQTGRRQNFVTRRAALEALGELDGLPLITPDRLRPDEVYELSLRASLSIEDLPLPLRPWAYLDPDWEHDSEWTRWTLQP